MIVTQTDFLSLEAQTQDFSINYFEKLLQSDCGEGNL